MSITVRFNTAKFDVSKERQNPINPIYGESLLVWLKEKTIGKVEYTDIEAEDWGWISFITFNGRKYLLGSSASDEENGPREWILQIDKQRSMKEKLFGKEKMLSDDPCAIFLIDLLKQQKDFNDLAID